MDITQYKTTSADHGVVAVAGEALMDMVPAQREGLFEAAPGGSPANVAVGLARLDVPVRMVARLADDLLGRRLRAHLANNGVDLSCAVRAVEPSSLAIVAVGQDGRVEYDFRIDGTADWLWQDEELAGVFQGRVAALHTGSLALARPPGAEVLHRLVGRARATTTISYDPNCRPLLMGSPDSMRDRVERMVSFSDIVKASAEDIAWLLPGRAPEKVAEAWLERGPGLVVVTLGPEGAVAAIPGTGAIRRPGRRVPVVDTVGAGDSFTSALLAGLYRRRLLGVERRPALRALDVETLAAILDDAILASAVTCTRRGADPPRTEELLAAGGHLA
ncbi:MAG: carbohydrate kinase [Chloroflexi bacterium]|nr:carbohydrate kinase [Chloroflexota bacterium]